MFKQPKINVSALTTLLLSVVLMLPIAEKATSQSTQPRGNAVDPSGPRVVEPTIELTPEQKVDLEKAKIEAKKFKEEGEKRTKPVFYKDKKLNSTKINNSLYASTSGKLYAAIIPTTSRPGIFMISHNDSSSSSASWAGGHAAIVYSEYNTIEAYGNKSASENGVLYWPNNWEKRYAHFTARTVSSTTTSQDQQAVTRASQQVTKPYNWYFYDIDQDNSFYCSQLVYRQFKVLFGIDLNYGGGAVWPGDLMSTENAVDVYTQ